MPRPRLAKKKSSGIEMMRTRTRIVAIDPIAIAIKALGHGSRHVDACLAQHDEQHGREPEDEDDLPDRAGVPADHGDRRAVPLARVPARQRRQREEQAEEERETAAESGDVTGTGKPAAAQTRALHRVSI